MIPADLEKPRYGEMFLRAIFVASSISNFNCGFALGSFGASSKIVQLQTGWDSTVIIAITSFGILGLMIGALITDKILPMGRIKTLFLANLIISIGIIPQMWLNAFSLCLGRLLLGFGAGVCIVAISVYNTETIPADKLSIYGTSVNFGIVFGLLMTNFIQVVSLPLVLDN